MTRLLLCLTAGALAATASAPAADAADGDSLSDLLEARTYTDDDGKTLPYRLLRPESVEEGKTYPLVLFLHGAGERGDDNAKQLVHGVPEFASPENRRDYPCFLAAPQCPEDSWWSAVDRRTISAPTLGAEPSEPGRLALLLVEALKDELPIDPDRVYITGLSMGGFGTWDLISRHPERFAAAVPVCGGGDPAQAEKIARLPIWAFHGAKDPVVKPEQSRRMIRALWEAGSLPGYTEYPDVEHASWVPAYRDAQMFRWLFQQKRDGGDGPR